MLEGWVLLGSNVSNLNDWRHSYGLGWVREAHERLEELSKLPGKLHLPPRMKKDLLPF